MYIGLLALLALYVCVFTNCYIEANGRYLYEIPANSSETLYLLGYSSELNNSNIRCVQSEYHNRTGETVTRILSTSVYNKTTEQWDKKTFVTFIGIPESPIILSINITEQSGTLVNLTGALPSYKVIHYDNDTMILGNIFATMGGARISEKFVKSPRFP
ncbi:japanin-like [Dermacentor variabilis]|uniref:japanin-like n=1 Tax=Dermacentor variabilis TaxID=34621 RepID=UPI003F5CAB5C